MEEGAEEKGAIVDVWPENLEQEFVRIRELVDAYPYVAFDTEFPGIVARPLNAFKTTHEYHYQTLKDNCDMLKLIQLGLSLFDEKGNRPPGTCTWQFNFEFNRDEDMGAFDSLELLEASGIDFARHAASGIRTNDFAELLITSGLVLSPKVKWITFHGAFDFGYLLKALTAQALPKDESDFFSLFQLWFPFAYDLKFMMKSCESLSGSLTRLAEDVEVKRIGTEHQAGSDSFVTGAAFFKMRHKFFEDQIDDDKFCSVIYGLGHLASRRLQRSQLASAFVSALPPGFEQ
jgi:CCR4-NOT transcription complex subunit 7/8